LSSPDHDRHYGNRWRPIAFWIGFGNFFVFWATSAAFGSALHGSFGGGHYFLRNHGAVREVSETAYIISYAYGIFSLIGLGFAFWLKRPGQDQN
jgi:hypothetical protein